MHVVVETKSKSFFLFLFYFFQGCELKSTSFFSVQRFLLFQIFTWPSTSVMLMLVTQNHFYSINVTQDDVDMQYHTGAKLNAKQNHTIQFHWRSAYPALEK